MNHFGVLPNAMRITAVVIAIPSSNMALHLSVRHASKICSTCGACNHWGRRQVLPVELGRNSRSEPRLCGQVGQELRLPSLNPQAIFSLIDKLHPITNGPMSLASQAPNMGRKIESGPLASRDGELSMYCVISARCAPTLAAELHLCTP